MYLGSLILIAGVAGTDGDVKLLRVLDSAGNMPGVMVLRKGLFPSLFLF